MARAEVERLKAEGAAAEVIEEKEAEAAMFEGTEEEQAAAVRLQAMQRGRMARAEVARLKESGAKEEEVAAAEEEVQEAASFEGTPEEQAAATKLQAVQRGRMARSKVSKMKDGGLAEEVPTEPAAPPPSAPEPKPQPKPEPQPQPQPEEEEEEEDVIVEDPTPVPQGRVGPVSYSAATRYTTVADFPLAEVERSFQEAAKQGDGIRATRLELATAILNNATLAPMMDQPARTPIVDDESGADPDAPSAETLQAIIAELRSVEGTSDEDVAIGIEAFFTFFGAGPDDVEALSTAVFDLQGDELVERGEEELIQQLNRELGRDHDGDAKVVLLGGAGAKEGKRSVYRFWPDIVKRAAEESSDKTGTGTDATGETVTATERDIFEDDVGAQYALSDMSVLDLASLHWSKPRTVGNTPPERVGHASVVVPMRIHATPSTQMTTPEPGDGSPSDEPEAGSDGRYGYDGSVQLSSLVAHCAEIARQGKHDDKDIFAQQSLGKVLVNTLMHCWSSSLRKRGRTDGYIPASHVTELVRLLDGGRADPPVGGGKEGGDEGDTEGDGDTARLLRQMLEAMDAKTPPREKDGARDAIMMKRAFLSSAALLSALPRIMRDAEKRTTGTPEHLVFAADSLVLTGGAPSGARCMWVTVECATPVDSSAADESADESRQTQTEVPEELSFRTPYFFPGANGGWAPEGVDPEPPAKPGQTRCDFGWETAINVGYAGRNASTMRASLVRMVEKKLRHSLSFTVYAAVDATGGGGAGAGDVPDLEEIKVGEVKVDLVDIVESGRDVSHDWLPVLSVDSGAQIGWIKTTVYAQRALRTMLSPSSAYLGVSGCRVRRTFSEPQRQGRRWVGSSYVNSRR